MTAALGALGRPVLQAVAAVGRVALFAASVLGHILRPPFYLRELGTAYQKQNSLLCSGIDQDNAKVRLGEGALASNSRQQFALDHRQAYLQILKGRQPLDSARLSDAYDVDGGDEEASTAFEGQRANDEEPLRPLWHPHAPWCLHRQGGRLHCAGQVAQRRGARVNLEVGRAP